MCSFGGPPTCQSRLNDRLPALAMSRLYLAAKYSVFRGDPASYSAANLTRRRELGAWLIDSMQSRDRGQTQNNSKRQWDWRGLPAKSIAKGAIHKEAALATVEGI